MPEYNQKEDNELNDFTATALNQYVTDMIKQNQEAISKELFLGTDDSMSTEKATSFMIANCISLSVRLSVQAILGLLEDAEILALDEHQIAKLFLKPLSSEPQN